MSKIWPGLSIDSKYIHQGGWTNWNEYYLDGGRITTTKQTADLLMIFIGILFVFMEAGLCSLVTFALFFQHRWSLRRGDALNPKPKSQDALWHQKRTILRNSGTFWEVATSYLSLSFTYGWSKHGILLRTLPVIAFASVLSLVFLIALPFLTTFVLLHEEGNQVLITSPHCGIWGTDDDEPGMFATEQVTRRNTAVQYVDSCYETNSDSGLCDNLFVNRTLGWKMEEVGCPFDPICINHKEKPAVRLETEQVDSHNHLGLNAPLHDRIQFRRNVTCSPIDLDSPRSENMTGEVMGLEWPEDETLMVAKLGSHVSHDWTFFASYKPRTPIPAYSLHGFEAYGYGGVFYKPIDELQIADALVSLVFLTNDGVHQKEICFDPFFRSTAQKRRDMFFPDKPLTIIGCSEQFTFYNPTTKNSSAPTNITGAVSTTEEKIMLIEKHASELKKELNLNEKQFATLKLLLWSLSSAGSIGMMLATIGTNALRAKKVPGMAGWEQLKIPENQWQHEVGYWVNIGLATLQLEFVRFATGPQNSTGLVSGPDVKLLCGSQMIKHSEFENFRRSGFISLAALGGFLILSPWAINKLLIRCGRKWQWPFVLEWISYGHMQLLRMANEGAGLEGWKGCDEEIPSIEADSIAHVDLGIGVGVETTGHSPPHPRMAYSPPATDIEMQTRLSAASTVKPAEQRSQSQEVREYEDFSRLLEVEPRDSF